MFELKTLYIDVTFKLARLFLYFCLELTYLPPNYDRVDRLCVKGTLAVNNVWEEGIHYPKR